MPEPTDITTSAVPQHFQKQVITPWKSAGASGLSICLPGGHDLAPSKQDPRQHDDVSNFRATKHVNSSLTMGRRRTHLPEVPRLQALCHHALWNQPANFVIAVEKRTLLPFRSAHLRTQVKYTWFGGPSKKDGRCLYHALQGIPAGNDPGCTSSSNNLLIYFGNFRYGRTYRLLQLSANAE